MSHVILAYGWYGRGNVGDELMKRALLALFSARGVELKFLNKIDAASLNFVDGVLFGGGSILDGEPNITSEALDVLLAQKLPVFYVGVGKETNVHQTHAKLLSIAKVVKYREVDMSDLAYSLNVDDSAINDRKNARGILFIPNIETVPTHASAHWVHVAWEHFKDEVAQALDHFIDRQIPVTFMLMCKNSSMEDSWACSELIAHMRRRGWKKDVVTATDDPAELCALASKHRVVVSQRYHGIILAEMAGVPYVAIEHHDKLKNVNPHRGMHVSYHGVTKSELIKNIESAIEGSGLAPHRPSHNTYDLIVSEVIDQIGRTHVR